jgi:hypothetical protein
MTGALSKSQIKYVLYHVNQHVNIDLLKWDVLLFGAGHLRNAENKRIVFPLSKAPLNLDEIVYVNEVPVLFPISASKEGYRFDSHGNLVFEHDFLKSIFYLLSGYQEYIGKDKRDKYGRYPFKESIQNSLGVIDQPLVNYYMDIIIKAILKFSVSNGLEIKQKRLFKDVGLLLTHDVDLVHYYSIKSMLYKWAQLVGLRTPNYRKRRLLKAALDSLWYIVFPFRKSDPFWSFQFIMTVERDCNCSSTWFFLNKDGSDKDSDYSINDRSIRAVIHELKAEGHEIGLHSSFKVAGDESALLAAKTELARVVESELLGVRNHFLNFEFPASFLSQKAAGLRYDSTLGFSEHEGFRNGYCYPFKPYDFEKDEMIDMWEIPLCVMDQTLFQYQKYDFILARDKVSNLITEVKKFGGTFSLLWHNSFFDEFQYPGISLFYERLMRGMSELNVESVTGCEVISRLEKGLK